MAGEKKRQGRRAHLNDFYRDVAGNYVYTGTCYVCRAADGERAALLRRLWLLTAVMAAAVVAGGCISAPGMSRCFYVLLPYMIALVAAISCLWTIGELTGGGDPLRQYVHDATVLKLPGRAMVSAVAALACISGEIVSCALNGADGEIGALIAFFLLLAVGAGAMVLLRRRICGAVWQITG